MFYFFVTISIALILWYILHKNKQQTQCNKPIKQIENLFIEIDKKNLKSNPTISILTYNILCQKYMKRKNRPDLNLQSRMKTITEEVNSLKADIILFQEFNIPNYKTYIINNNNFPNYNFEYGDNYGSHLINVTGYNKKRFKLISKFNFYLFDIKVPGNRGVLHTILEDLITGKKISIYNVHFPWNPVYDFEKCEILSLISENISKIKIKRVIVAGDFNSLPNSMVLRLIYVKYLQAEIQCLPLSDEKDAKEFNEFIEGLKIKKEMIEIQSDNKILKNFVKGMISDDKKKEKFKSFITNFKNLSSEYEFRSSYENYKEHRSSLEHFTVSEKAHLSNFIHNHPEYTNYTHNFKNTIDYIFYSSNFILKRILQLPNKAELQKEEFLPSSKFPSDHLKLYSEFYYTH